MTSTDASKEPAAKPATIGFSVRDILELPSTKQSHSRSVSSRSSSLLPLRPEASSLDGSLGDPCVPASSYHPSAIYYCDSSYPRWLPPSDVFSYSNPLCKYRANAPQHCLPTSASNAASWCVARAVCSADT